MPGFRARCRREEWREFSPETYAFAWDNAPVRRNKARNEVMVKCDESFTDRKAFEAHMKAHKIYPIQHHEPPWTKPEDYRTGPILTRLAKRRPNPDLGHLDRLVYDKEAVT